MNLSGPLYISMGLRYAFSSGSHRFASFVSILSMLGIMLGTAALIVVISVMNGFEGELKDRLLSVIPHAEITSESGWLPAEYDLDRLNIIPGVVQTMPEVSDDVIVQGGHTLTGAVLYGVDPKRYPSDDLIRASLGSTVMFSIAPGSYNVIIGSSLARQLKVTVGDKIRLISAAHVRYTPLGRLPSQRLFTVSGIFSAGAGDAESTMILVSLEDARKLIHMSDDRITGIRLWLQDPFSVGNISLKNSGIKDPVINDWRKVKGEFFQSVAMEKIMMSLMLGLIILVAVFNMLSALVMVVAAKIPEIAILRTLGMKRRTVMGIFVTEGALSGILGTACGVALGLIVVMHIDIFMRLIGLNFYFSAYGGLPVLVVPVQIVIICGISLLLSFLVTLYPAYRAAMLRPATSLRYE